MRSSTVTMVTSRSGKPRHLTVSTYSLTDCGNAERLVDQHGDSIRFCRAADNWFVWNGCRWAADGASAVQLAKKTVRAMQQDRQLLSSQADRDPTGFELLRSRADALAKWETRSESAQRITSMLRLAASDPRISAEPEDFDQNPWLLNLSNGTIDLRSAQIREHRPEEPRNRL